jgi:L-fuconolactonase
MFGSDWPVCLVASTYQRWTQVLQNAMAQFSAAEQHLFWGETATRVYRLKEQR